MKLPTEIIEKVLDATFNSSLVTELNFHHILHKWPHIILGSIHKHYPTGLHFSVLPGNQMDILRTTDKLIDENGQEYEILNITSPGPYIYTKVTSCLGTHIQIKPNPEDIDDALFVDNGCFLENYNKKLYLKK